MKKIIPQHIGIIMDGNRRWARQHRLPLVQGHRKGYERAIAIAEHAFDQGVRFLTLYAFSTENWNRARYEVQYLLQLLLRMIDEQSQRLHKRGIRVLVIGSRKRLNKKILTAIERAQTLTRHNTNGTLLIAFNYGGRSELVEAVESIVREKRVVTVTEKLIEDHLKTAGIPDPELIIRTSGEQRLSGFLLWQSAYSELYFTPRFWPSFTNRDFDRAIEVFNKRSRRFGT